MIAASDSTRDLCQDDRGRKIKRFKVFTPVKGVFFCGISVVNDDVQGGKPPVVSFADLMQ